MNVAYFDCIGGASGNMLLGALLDVGADVHPILAGLPVSGWSLELTSVHRASLGATHLEVRTTDDQPHRHLSDIEALLRQADLPAPVRDRSLHVFRKLAEAEARVHRTSVEEVHFHEVGAVDAIIDVVGTVAALHVLDVGEIRCSPLPMGRGVIHCAHGTFPNPAPATVELLRGVPVRTVDVEAELVTPTGAALLTGLDAHFGSPLPERWTAVGYGAGSRDLPFPNVVRVLLGPSARQLQVETLMLLETNVDDASPQIHGALMDQLLEAGALDVTLTPILMKKSRPAVQVAVLCAASLAPLLRDVLLSETTTLGVRQQAVERFSLAREVVEIATPYGPARVKRALDADGKVLKVIPEYEDCLRLARSARVQLQRVIDEVRRLGWGGTDAGRLKFKVSDIPPNEGRIVEDGERAFAVFNLNGKLHAMENACLHRGGPLGEGYVEDGVVICPWHGWEFDITTGTCLLNPAMAQTCYPVRVDGDAAEIIYD